MEAIDHIPTISEIVEIQRCFIIHHQKDLRFDPQCRVGAGVTQTGFEAGPGLTWQEVWTQ